MSDIGGQKSEERIQRADDRRRTKDVRIQKSQAGMWKDECGRGKYSISDNRMDNGKICVDDKIKNGYLALKNQHSNIPPFHFSMIGART